MTKTFRVSALLLIAFTTAAGIATIDQVPDGANWAEKYLAITAGIAPWFIASVIVWAAGDIISAMKEDADS